MKPISGLEVVIWCGALLIFPQQADGDQIYLLLTHYGGGTVFQINLDGSDLKRMSLPNLGGPFAFAAVGFNHADQKLYWSDHDGGIGRSSPNGDDVEIVIGPGESNPIVPVVDGVGGDAHALAFDQQFIYWGAGAEPYLISRLNLAAEADIEPIIRSTDHGNPWVYGLAVDSISGTVYWTDEALNGPTGTLSRANLDGSNIATIARPTKPGKVALDGELLYWVDGGLNRSRLDGSDAVQIIPFVSTFVLDPRTNSIIFARESTLMRATILGENIETIATLPLPISDMTLRTNVPEPSSALLALFALVAADRRLTRFRIRY